MDENLMQISAAKIMHANVMESDRKNHNVTKNIKNPVDGVRG